MIKLIGENINIISKSLGPAIRERRSTPILDIAKQMEYMDYIDLNIGPSKKDGAEVIEWLIKEVQSVSSKKLSIDTTNSEAMYTALRLLQDHSPLINSISLQPERLEEILPAAAQSGADVIGLLWCESGMPRDINERCMLAVELLLKTAGEGIPNEKIWLDPIATPVSGDIAQVLSTVEFLHMLPEIAPGCKSVVGLSNVSNGVPAHLRHYLNAVYLIMLKRTGLHAAIIDCLDRELIAIARGGRPELEQMVYDIMDGNETAADGSEMEKYYKTAMVLTGKNVFSNAWLD